MKPKRKSKNLLSITRSKAKMYEYSILLEDHINISEYNPAKLYKLSISLIGDLSYYIIEDNLEKVHEIKKNLLFSAQFFDALLQSNLDEGNSDYLKLIGSAAYYLCDLPGSSNVLLESIGEISFIKLECGGLDILLYSILSSRNNLEFIRENKYRVRLKHIFNFFKAFNRTGLAPNYVIDLISSLRKKIYLYGNDRELLFVDILYAIIKVKIKNSTWVSLPAYSGLDKNTWLNVLKKDTFIKELWPAQHLLGEKGVYKGQSAVIQMPTSAGKTKSTELIIRSSFLSGRSKLAIIVAPFRALCNEIKNDLIDAFKDEDIEINELSDILQINTNDNIDSILESIKNRIIVLTPEKLYFLLKHYPDLSLKIGLLIYDEGHQFDNGTRGVTYELLLSSLKQYVSHDVQTVLISAVIGNAIEINNWLNSERGDVIEGSSLIPTYRTIGFTSWRDSLGQIKFINNHNPDLEEYFVPRVIQKQKLELKGAETKQRFFPEKNNQNSIGLYLGLKLTKQGSIAIFSGTKVSVLSMCKSIVDAYDRNLSLDMPIKYSNMDEIKKITKIYELHFGRNNPQTNAVSLGILTHHSNLPQGIKLSVEYALQKSLAKFVICTSTLAQGVNLPIRYLIVPTVYQAGRKINVRDFHNLIGRVGRAGKYTEGSVLFTNPKLYDEKNNTRFMQGGNGKWKWDGVKKLLDHSNSENSNSMILLLFDDILTTYGKEKVSLDLLVDLLNDPNYSGLNKDIIKQLEFKKEILNSIESYILMNIEEVNIHKLVENTLAYYTASENHKKDLISLFETIEKNISERIPKNKIKVYSKTLAGLDNVIKIENWLNENYNELLQIGDTISLLHYMWDFILINLSNQNINNFKQKDYLFKIASTWISGESYYEIYQGLKSKNIKIKTRKLTIEHIIDICEQGFSFDLSLFLSNIIELIDLYEESEYKEGLKEILKVLQKQVKYGLNKSNEITLFELGFVDRIVSQEVLRVLNVKEESSFRTIKRKLINNQDVESLLESFPEYFKKVYQQFQ